MLGFAFGFEQLPIDFGQILEQLLEFAMALGHLAHFVNQCAADVFDAGFSVLRGGEVLRAELTVAGRIDIV